jgi:uncharacterized membrane protein
MSKGRLEAFSDGVIAIIITIMVLELRAPHSVELSALRSLVPVFSSYVVSFTFVGIYWNNHHHLFQAARRVNGRILWANLHLLFWLSLIPFVTAWTGENHFAPLPVAAYGVVMLFAGVAYYLLVHSLLAHHDRDSALAAAMGTDFKGRISVVIYVVAIPLAFVNAGVACACYLFVGALWLVPDQRIEKVLSRQGS